MNNTQLKITEAALGGRINIVSDDRLAPIAALIKDGRYLEALVHEGFDFFLEKLGEGAPFPGHSAESSLKARQNTLKLFCAAVEVKYVEMTDYAVMVGLYRVLRATAHAMVYDNQRNGGGIGCLVDASSDVFPSLYIRTIGDSKLADELYFDTFGDHYSPFDPYKYGYCYLAMLTDGARRRVVFAIHEGRLSLGPILDYVGYSKLKVFLKSGDYQGHVFVQFDKDRFHLVPDNVAGALGARSGAEKWFMGLDKWFTARLHREQGVAPLIEQGTVDLLVDKVVAYGRAPVNLKRCYFNDTYAVAVNRLLDEVMEKFVCARSNGTVIPVSLAGKYVHTMAALTALVVAAGQSRDVSAEVFYRFVYEWSGFMTLLATIPYMKSWLTGQVLKNRYHDLFGFD